MSYNGWRHNVKVLYRKCFKFVKWVLSNVRRLKMDNRIAGSCEFSDDGTTSNLMIIGKKSDNRSNCKILSVILYSVIDISLNILNYNMTVYSVVLQNRKSC